MDKRILIGLCVIVGIIIVAVAIHKIKEKYDGKNLVLVLYATPSLRESADKLDLEKLSNFTRRFFTNAVSATIVNVTSGSLKSPYTGALSITINGINVETILIASTDFYKTQQLTVEQLENAIYENPRVIKAFETIKENYSEK